MSRAGRMRWLAFREWERTPASLEVRLAVGTAEVCLAIGLIWAFRGESWAGFLAIAILVCDYLAWSVIEQRRRAGSGRRGSRRLG